MTDTSEDPDYDPKTGRKWYEDPSVGTEFSPRGIETVAPALQICIVERINDSEPGPKVFGCIYDPPDDETACSEIVTATDLYRSSILKRYDGKKSGMQAIDKICGDIVKHPSLAKYGITALSSAKRDVCPSGNTSGHPGTRKGTHVVLPLWDTRTSSGSNLTAAGKKRNPPSTKKVKEEFLGSTIRSLGTGPYPDTNRVHKIQYFGSMDTEHGTFRTDRVNVILPDIFSRAPLAAHVWGVASDFKTPSMIDMTDASTWPTGARKRDENVVNWSDTQLAEISKTLNELAEKARQAGFNCGIEGIQATAGREKLCNTGKNCSSDLYLVLRRDAEEPTRSTIIYRMTDTPHGRAYRLALTVTVPDVGFDVGLDCLPDDDPDGDPSRRERRFWIDDNPLNNGRLSELASTLKSLEMRGDPNPVLKTKRRGCGGPQRSNKDNEDKVEGGASDVDMGVVSDEEVSSDGGSDAGQG